MRGAKVGEVYEGQKKFDVMVWGVPTVRAEAGCIEYGPAVDVPTGVPAQGPIRDNVVTIVEKWESLDALRAHLAAPHMAEYRARVKEFVSKVQLQVLQPA